MLKNSDAFNLKGKIAVVDLSYLIHRSYKAGGKNPTVFPHPDSASSTVPMTIDRIKGDLQPEEIHFAIEDGHKHRDEIYSAYKTRDPKEPELIAEYELIVQELVKNGESVIYAKDYEADDVMATMAYLHDKNCVLVTADKDMHQLCNICHIYHPYDRREVTAQDVIEKWGVNPRQLGDLLALMGDDADSIPGVSRIGSKTAAKLLKEHYCLDGILDVAEEMSEKTGKVIWKTLAENKSDAIMSRRLVQLVSDVKIEQVTHEGVKPLDSSFNAWDIRRIG
jgi:DNA polymerase-1